MDSSQLHTQETSNREPVMPKEKLVWKKTPEEEDFRGALNFLSLVCPNGKCGKILRALRKAKTIERAAKDLLRASDLPLLPRDEPHVDHDLKKIYKGNPIAPVLLIRGDMRNGVPVVVADGYHRICAIYYYDEDAPVRCRIASV
jgi:hypothetical protein